MMEMWLIHSRDKDLHSSFVFCWHFVSKLKNDRSKLSRAFHEFKLKIQKALKWTWDFNFLVNLYCIWSTDIFELKDNCLQTFITLTKKKIWTQKLKSQHQINIGKLRISINFDQFCTNLKKSLAAAGCVKKIQHGFWI